MVDALGITNISERSRKRLEEFLSLFLPPRRLFSGRTYFNIYLVNGHERVSEKPVIDKALYSVGGKGVLAWIEIGYYGPEVTFKKEKGNLPETTNIAFTDFIEKFPDAKDVELVGRCKDNAREIRDRILKSRLKTRQDRQFGRASFVQKGHILYGWCLTL